MALLMEHDENIYNIIPQRPVYQEKPPMFKSKSTSNLPPTGSTFGQAGTSHPIVTNLAGNFTEKVVPNHPSRQWGKPLGSYKSKPDKYLKKGDKNGGSVPTLAEVHKTAPHLLKPSKLKTKLKPEVPKVGENPPVMNLVTSKNFIVANAVETILAAPKKVSEGAKDYLNKEDFGCCPKYLKKIKEDISAEYDYIRLLQEEEDERQRANTQVMDEDERLALIEGLKAKWEVINTNYQAITHLTKLEAGQIRRKEKFEAELSNLERDIERLSKKGILIDMTS
eukprot:gnl/TRDRNA2_/TRDRNA2_186673_c0_seq1.p1 gnl/TRDRNA2_/TRDRNA2_186673_c0~~gnl/TRDRNA2_/TRDRNA2_186673_c0_seq1.p1  ORF type:complete len:280 (+),score=75.76 gnl/TRDRNA2_/TRDRNA2_186673_c0_seq1:144-983(+)